MKERLLTLNEHRRRRLLSIRELAQLAGVSTNTILAVESRGRSDRLRPSSMRKLAKALNVDPLAIREFAQAAGLDVDGDSA